MNRPKTYMTANSFSDHKLRTYSVGANILLTPIPEIRTAYNQDVFMVIARRLPMSAGEEELLKEERSKAAKKNAAKRRREAFDKSKSSGCVLLYHPEHNVAYFVGDKQKTERFKSSLWYQPQ